MNSTIIMKEKKKKRENQFIAKLLKKSLIEQFNNKDNSILVSTVFQ